MAAFASRKAFRIQASWDWVDFQKATDYYSNLAPCTAKIIVCTGQKLEHPYRLGIELFVFDSESQPAEDPQKHQIDYEHNDYFDNVAADLFIRLGLQFLNQQDQRSGCNRCSRDPCRPHADTVDVSFVTFGNVPNVVDCEPDQD